MPGEGRHAKSEMHRMGDTADSCLTLSDGRVLGYAQYGDSKGKPVIYCHGFPASRLEGRLIDAAAKRLGARILAIDRPGYGLSEFQLGRRLRDWPADVVALADELVSIASPCSAYRAVGPMRWPALVEHRIG